MRIVNSQFIEANEKGDVLINTLIGTKVISFELLVPGIDHNPLSIG